MKKALIKRERWVIRLESTDGKIGRDRSIDSVFDPRGLLSTYKGNGIGQMEQFNPLLEHTINIRHANAVYKYMKGEEILVREGRKGRGNGSNYLYKQIDKSSEASLRIILLNGEKMVYSTVSSRSMEQKKEVMEGRGGREGGGQASSNISNRPNLCFRLV